MFKNIVKESIQAMGNDNKIIRLTRVTSFFHSMIAIMLIIINVNSLITKNYENGLYVGKVTQYLVEQISKHNFTMIVLVITVIFFLLYSIIYPIGQGAIIHYLNDKEHNIKDALKKGRKEFFYMFEASILSVVFHPIVLIITAFQVLIIDGHMTIMNIILFGIRLTALNVINTLKAYVRYVVVIEKLPLYEALKRSAKICFKNMNNNYKYMRVQTVLLINFSINLLIIIGIPFLLIYGSIALNIIQYRLVQVLMYIIFFLIVIFGSYMSAIIRAFFVYYRYKIYQIAKK